MILFHGTANYNLVSFQTALPRKYPQGHLKGKAAFCTSLSLEEAAKFALRKTPMNDLTKTGIILEFDGNKLSAKDYTNTRDARAIRDEQEVAVFNVKPLTLIAYWNLKKNGWERIAL